MKGKKILVIVIIIVAVLAVAGTVFGYLFLKTDLLKSNKELFAKYVNQNFDSFKEISNLKSFSNPGYSFGGWYYDMGLKNKVEFPLTVNKSITLYGGWYENLNFEFDCLIYFA